jgi:hypothetical protein
MKEKDLDKLCEIIQMQQDGIRDLRSCNKAFLMVLKDLAKIAPPEARKIILRYNAYKKKCAVDSLLALEKHNPERAALLDIARPLILPDDEV